MRTSSRGKGRPRKDMSHVPQERKSSRVSRAERDDKAPRANASLYSDDHLPSLEAGTSRVPEEDDVDEDCFNVDKDKEDSASTSYDSNDNADEDGTCQDNSHILKNAKSSRAGKKRQVEESVNHKLVAEFLSGRVDHGELAKLAAMIPQKNAMKRARLVTELTTRMPLWRAMLRSGNSLLFYGWGSKRELLGNFLNSITDGGAVVFNGFSASLTARTVLSVTAGVLIGKAPAKDNTCNDLIKMIEDEEEDDRRVYVLIHNIDGPGLRDSASQTLLSRMAASRSVHLIASVDHVNAGLLWDSATAARFKWTWVHSPTYAPYGPELKAVPPPLTGMMRSAKSLHGPSVLRSLVINARQVFRVLATAQLEDGEEEGLGFQLLLRMCRERSIVYNAGALRTHMTELLEHELVRSKTDAMGEELLSVPMNAAALKALLEEMDTWEQAS